MSPGCDSQQDPEPWPCLQQHAPLLPSSPFHLVSPELLFWTLLAFPDPPPAPRPALPGLELRGQAAGSEGGVNCGAALMQSSVSI